MKVNFYRNTANKILNVINNDIKVSDFNIKEPDVILCLKIKTKEIIRIVKAPAAYADILYQVIFDEDWFCDMGYKPRDYFDQMEVLVRNKYLNNLVYVDFRLINKEGNIRDSLSFPRILYRNCVISNNVVIDFDNPYPKTRFVNCIKEM